MPPTHATQRREEWQRVAAGAGDPPPPDSGSSTTNTSAKHDNDLDNNTNNHDDHDDEQRGRSNVRSSGTHRHSRRGRGERPGSSSDGIASEQQQGAVIRAWEGAKETGLADIRTPDRTGAGRQHQQHSTAAGGSLAATERSRCLVLKYLANYCSRPATATPVQCVLRLRPMHNGLLRSQRTWAQYPRSVLSRNKNTSKTQVT